MNLLNSAGQMPTVTAAADSLPLQAKAAAINSLPSAATLLAVGEHVVPGSRTRPTGGPGGALLQHHLRRPFPLSAAEPSLSVRGVARAGLHTPAQAWIGGDR